MFSKYFLPPPPTSSSNMENLLNIDSKQPEQGHWQPGLGERASGSVWDQPGQAHGQIRQSIQGHGQSVRDERNLDSFHEIAGNDALARPGLIESGSGHEQQGGGGGGGGSTNVGQVNTGQAQPPDGSGQSTHAQLMQRQRQLLQQHGGVGQSEPTKVQGGGPQPSQSRKGDGSSGLLQGGTTDHARDQLGEGEVVVHGRTQHRQGSHGGRDEQAQQGSDGRTQPRPGSHGGRDKQGQQGHLLRTQFQGQAMIHQPYQPRPKSPVIDTIAIKDIGAVQYRNWGFANFSKWKSHVESELELEKKKSQAADARIASLQKANLEIQLENERLSFKFRQCMEHNEETTATFTSIENIIGQVNDRCSSIEEALKEAVEEKDKLELALKEKDEIFPENYNNFLKNNEHLMKALSDRVEAAVQAMQSKHHDLLSELSIKGLENDEKSMLLKSNSEELKIAYEKLKESTENCVRLEDTNRSLITGLEQAQEEINTMKTEMFRQKEVENTLRTERENAESGFARSVREYAEHVTELQRHCDELQNELRGRNLKVEQLETDREELTRVVIERWTKDAAIRDRLEKTIQELRVDTTNMKTEADNNSRIHKETLEYLAKLKQENASGLQTISRMEQHDADMDKVNKEREDQINEMARNQVAMKNAFKNASEIVNGLQSELYRERQCRADSDISSERNALENKELKEQLSCVANERCEFRNLYETSKLKEEELILNLHKFELNYTNIEQALESAQAHHEAKFEAQNERYATLNKDFESQIDSLQKEHEQALNNLTAELSDCKNRITQFEQRECEQMLANKVTDFASLNQKYNDSREKNDTLVKALADAREINVKMEKTKEELEQKSKALENDAAAMRSEISNLKKTLQHQTPVSAPAEVIKKPFENAFKHRGVVSFLTQKRKFIYHLNSNSADSMDFQEPKQPVTGDLLKLLELNASPAASVVTKPKEQPGSFRKLSSSLDIQRKVKSASKIPKKPCQETEAVPPSSSDDVYAFISDED